MNSLLLWLGALLAAVLAALFAVPHLIDWNLYRGQFEAEASRILGREVRVGGSVIVSVLPSPHMSFGRVRVADVPLDPTEPPGEPILRADSIELGLGISGLLRGEMEVQNITVVRPDVRLTLGADGRGNWQTFGRASGTRSAMGGDITIANLSLMGGRVRLTGANGQDLVVLQNIDGEVEQVLGTGPLRFRGAMDWGGERHDVRISSAEGDPGAVKLKASLRALGSGNTLTFDGSLADVAKVPRVSGDVIAKVSGGKPQTGAAVSATGGFELRARVEGDGRSARLDNVSFSFEREGQPQLVTGSIDVRWAEGVDIAADLQSRWIDLDRVLATGQAARPVDVASTFGRSVDALLPDRGRFRAKVAVDQVTLGGEAVSDVALSIAGQDGRLTLDRLEAALPGGGALRVGGVASADASQFEGRLLLRAASAGRMLGWATKTAVEVDGAFLVEGALRLTDQDVRLEGARGEIGGQSITGGIGRRFGSRPVTTLLVEADDLDIGGLFPGVLDSGRLLALLRGEKLAGAAAPPGYRWLDPALGDVTVRIKAGRMSDGTIRLTDVDADVAFTSDGVTVRRMKWVAPDDLSLSLSGDLSGGPSGSRKGALGWTLTAPNDAAVRRIASALHYSEGGSGRPLLLAPLRLSGNLVLPAVADAPVELSLDGRTRNTRVRALVRGSRLAERWLVEPMEADVELDGPDALAVVGLGVDRRAGDATGTGKLSARLAGSATKGLLVKLRGDNPAIGSLAFDGRLAKGDGATEITGKASLDVRDASEVALLARLPLTHALRDIPASGTVGLAMDRGGTTLVLDRLKLAGATVSGTILRPPAGGVEASLVTDRVAVRDLVSAVSTSTSGAATPSGLAAAGDGPSPWPDTPFDLTALVKAEGKLTLATPRLEIDRGAALQDVRLEIVANPGRIAIKSLSASLLDGRLTGALAIAAQPTDVTLDGELQLAEADLGAMTPGNRLGARGQASGRLALSGRGLSPRTLVQSVGGKGTVELKNVQLPGLSPLAVQRAAQAFLVAETPFAPGQLDTLVRNALSQGTLSVGSKSVPLEITAGALRVGQIRVETAEATMTNRTTLDLATFRTDSEWRAETRTRDVGTKRKEPLPPVTILYAAPAWDIARVEPKVQSEDLTRELAVRVMERDVEELERLRRLDEQRAREEAARRQALEEQQAKEAAAQAAAAVAEGRTALPPGTVLPGAVVSTPLPPPNPPAPAPQAEVVAPPQPKPAPKPATKSGDWWGFQYLYPSR